MRTSGAGPQGHPDLAMVLTEALPCRPRESTYVTQASEVGPGEPPSHQKHSPEVKKALLLSAPLLCSSCPPCRSTEPQRCPPGAHSSQVRREKAGIAAPAQQPHSQRQSNIRRASPLRPLPLPWAKGKASWPAVYKPSSRRCAVPRRKNISITDRQVVEKEEDN